jgi:hypothetical protein
MLRITITLLPASGGSAHEIGRLDIHNEDTTATSARGNYVARLMRRGTTDRVQRIAEVLDYPRESLPVWCLVHRALGQLFARGKLSANDGPTEAGEPAPAPAMDSDALQMAKARLGAGRWADDAAAGATALLGILQAIIDEPDAGVRDEALLALVPRFGAADVLATVAEHLCAAVVGGRRADVSRLLTALDAAVVAYREACAR